MHRSSLALIVGLLLWGGDAWTQMRPITYQLTARNLSKEAVGSYPQTLLGFERTDSIYRITVRTFAAYDDLAKRAIVLADRYLPNRTYSSGVRTYLKPTLLTNYRIEEVGRMVDSVRRLNCTHTHQVIKHLLDYTKRRLTFDQVLAMELDQGHCVTLPVEELLARGKGTCSEYTNLFLALARRAGIPCRMVVGVIYLPEKNFQGSHAWAECYIEGYGWLAVDPQYGYFWYPASAIKLFYGRDFKDCGIPTLPDMCPVTVEIVAQ